MSDEPAKGTFLTPERAVVLSRSAVIASSLLVLYIADYLFWGNVDPWVIYLWASKDATHGTTLVKHWGVLLWGIVIGVSLLAAIQAVRRPELPRTVILALAALASAVVLAIMMHVATRATMIFPI